VIAVRRRFLTAVAASCFLCLSTSGFSEVSERETAVGLARAGQVEQAINKLRALLASGSSDPIVPLDLAAILAQNGRAAEAIAIYEKTHPAQPPSYALAAMTRAYRDLKQFEQAAALGRSGMQRFPGEAVWPILLALILADQNKTEEATAMLSAGAALQAPEMERLLARAYVDRRAGRPFDALREYEAVLAQNPKNAEARGGAIAILREIRAPLAAARIAQEKTPLALAADTVAAMVRWGPLDTQDYAHHRFDATDRAINELDRLIARADAEGNSAITVQLRLDRIVAFRDRVRMAEAISEANALRAAGTVLPPYVREALADALLYMRQPEAARDEYDAVLRADPGNRDALAGRIYAAVETEDFASAYAQADELLKQTPVWRRYHEDPGRYPNEEFLDALILAAAVRFYGDQPEDAWQRLAPERDNAPRNPFLRLLAASIMNARKWPRAAEEENKIALGLSPSLLAAQIGTAQSALGRNRMGEARTAIAELIALYPEKRTVQQLNTDLAAQRGWQIEAEVRPSNERGGGEFGNSGDELKTSFNIHSPLIDDRWRLFAGYGYDNSHPPEGFVDIKRASGGVQLVLPDLGGNAAITQTFGAVSRTGFAGSVDWNPDDHLGFALTGERISSETPLRAFQNGITADLLSSRFSYTWDELRNASVGLGWMPFSDGNRRISLDARYAEKVVEVPHFDLTLQGELYGSTNSGKNAPYYNPVADGSVVAGILAEHTIWRRYEDSMVQALTLNGGMYGQRDFRGGPIWTASYEHRWRFDPWTELVYGVSLSQRRYDGEPAHDIGAFLTVRQRI
jgi:biofilm PGA synthesis protein PgaA